MIDILSGLLQQSFQTDFVAGRIVSLRAATDPFRTDYVAKDRALGDVRVWTRKGNEAWQEGTAENVQTGATGRSWRANGLDVTSRFEPKGDKLLWRIRVKNPSDAPIELGGLATPLPMRTRFDKDTKTSSVLKHSFVSGAGSFAFWMRPDSAGPYLTLTPLKGTAPEYWNRGPEGYQMFLHSASEVPTIKAQKGSWRLPHTSRTLKPGETTEYGYRLEWSKDYQGVRDALARNGGLDVQVAPGMTVPSDLTADVAFRTIDPVVGIDAEHPAQTDIRPVATRNGYRVYRVRFRRLGENRLTVRQRGGGKTYLEFFSCQPVETLMKKRAAFLTKAQVKDPAKWYDGLLREWNMDNRKFLSPDDYDRIKGWRIYEVTCDDPGLGKPGYLAAKNAEYPVQAEVTALDRYIEKFVWGGLQQTTKEPYPYGIYGIPDWKTLRESKAEDKTKGVDHVWRPYDYPHIALMYHSLYRVASQNPNVKTRLPAREYLKRAAGTATAMFTVPMKVTRWSAYGTGFYNELVIPRLIDDLHREGMTTEAEALKGHWERKVRRFVQGNLDLFTSEYAFDSTGFESTQALADYAIQNGKALGITQAQSRLFLDRQMAANLFCRGTVEPAYYLLGSDYRGGGGDGYTLSYMAPMGGWSVLDYALKYAKDPAPYLRLGYQSVLSSWALMNAGTPGSDYGYWYPGAENDGGCGGGFEPAAYGKTWLDQPHGRGSWYYSCETDLGYSGALRAARTTVADDPIFGRYCFGGTDEAKGETYRFTPKDGLRRRLSIRTAKTRLDLELDGAKIDPRRPVVLDDKAGSLTLWIEPTQTPSASLSLTGKGMTVRVKGFSVVPSGDRYRLGSGPGREVTILRTRSV